MTMERALQWPSRILMVEDSVIIAMEAERCLRELGVADVELATCVAEAMQLLDRSAFGLAILDYNLVDETSEPVAARLSAQSTPFAIVSGYTDLDDHFSQLGAKWILSKPYGKADLCAVLDAAAQLPRS
jgi:DNA-binding response OmpR family regulator